MAIFYVRTDATSNGNAGTGPSTTQAVQQLGTASALCSPGDAIYLAPGSYRKLDSMGASGAVGNPYHVIGDVDASHFLTADVVPTSGFVHITGHLTDDKTAPSAAAATILLNGKQYIDFQHICFHSSGNTNFGTIQANAITPSRGISFTECSFTQGVGSVCVQAYTVANTPLDWTFTRCMWNSPIAIGFQVTGVDPAAVSDVDLNILLDTCGAIGMTQPWVQFIGPATSSAGGKPGGVRLHNCTGLVNAIIKTTTVNNSSTIPCEVYGGYFEANSALQAFAAGQIVEDYNHIVAAVLRTNVTAGAHTITGTTATASVYAMLMHLGQETWLGLPPRLFLTPMPGSPQLGFGSTGSPTLIDFQNRPRPAGGASASLSVGYMERHDTYAKETSVFDSTPASVRVANPGDLQYYIAVNAAPVLLALKVRWDSSYGGGTLPQLQLLANAECGVAAQTVTATGSANAWNALSLSTFTPTDKGWVTIRLLSNAGAPGGFVYWDTSTLT